MKLSRRERIGLGQAFLDAKVPGWRDQINLDELDMEDCNSCILGQLFVDYNRGLKELGLTEDQAVAMGFDREWPLPMKEQKIDYIWLTRMWRKVLKAA